MNPEQSASTSLPPQKLPNATAVLVLSIIGVLLNCCCGPLALIFGIIALILANKDQGRYMLRPDHYTYSSYSNIKTGKILSYAAIALSIVLLIYYAMAFLGIIDFPGGQSYDDLMEEFKKGYEKGRFS